MADSRVLRSTHISYITKFIVSPFILIGAFLCILWFIPAPRDLSLQAWHLFAIFITTIIAIIANLFPMGALALMALAVACITQTLSIKQALSGFSSPVMWLILIAFLLARGFIKTGLGSRIAYYFVLHMGKSTIGLAYGLITTEFMLAPFTPSNTARGAGIVYPIVSALSEEYESTPKNGTERKIGSYLIQLGYQANVITSAMFLTATSGNPLIVILAQKLGIDISWTTWAFAALVPGLLNIALLPWIVRFLHKPEIEYTPLAPQFARKKLDEMGPLQVEEWLMLATFGLLLTLWICSTILGVDPTVAAMIGLSILLVTNVLTWDDILKEQNAWHTFIWLSTLLTLSTFLAEFGMISWFSDHMQSWVNTMPWAIALGVISLIYFYSHYAFASITAHISSMFSAFAVVAIAAGTPPMLAVLVLAFLSSLCAGITHYGTGTAPVYFSAEYVTLRDWWHVGGIVSVINIIIWCVVGSAWWKIIGLW